MSDEAAHEVPTWDGHWASGDPALADAFCELTGSDARRMLAAHGIRTEGQPVALDSQENRVFRVETAELGTVMMKVFRYGRTSTEALVEQAEVVDLLARAGQPVAGGVRLGDSSWIGEFEGQQFGLFKWAPALGPSPRSDVDVDFAALGAVVARFHESTASTALQYQLDYRPETWGRSSADFLLDSGVVHAAHRDAFAEAAERMLETAAALWPSDPLVPIHSDLGMWNVLWSEAGQPTLIDFEDLGLGLPWQDLYMLPHSFVNNDGCDQETADRIAALMQSGYESVRPLPAGDRSLAGVIEAMRGMHIDCWIASRRGDRHFGLRRLTFHTKRYWASRVDRLDRYREWAS